MVCNILDLDVSALKFSAVQKTKSGGKTVYINNPDGSPVIVQLGKRDDMVTAPFGVSRFENNANFDLTIRLDNENMVNKLRELDQRVLDHIQPISKQTLGREYKKDVLSALVRSCINDKNEKYDPLLKLKCQTDADGKIKATCYDSWNPDRSLIPMESVQKGHKLVVQAQISYIYFIDGKAGISVRLVKAVLGEFKDESSFDFEDDTPMPDDTENFFVD